MLVFYDYVKEHGNNKTIDSMLKMYADYSDTSKLIVLRDLGGYAVIEPELKKRFKLKGCRCNMPGMKIITGGNNGNT